MKRSPETPRNALKRSARLRRSLVEALEARRLLSVNVTMWHNDLAQTGLNANEQSLTPANVNSASFGKLLSYAVSGQVYAQPLYVANFNMPGLGTRNVVFVATMTNDVYAFDADSSAGATAGVLWHANLGTPAAVPSPFIGFRYGPDRDTTPYVGVTSTPVIDLNTGTMYLDAFTNDVVGQDAYSHHIHALDLTTGQDKVTPMLVSASVKGNGVGGDGTNVFFAANRQIQRTALRLFDGVLYAAYGAYADTNPYHGWMLGFDPSTLQLVSVLNTTPNNDSDVNENEGGIWQSGGGIASDGTSLYVETGNGDFNPTVGDYGDTVLRIAPDTSTPASPHITGYGLGITDYFTPFNEQALADADADLGSGGSMLLPDQPGAHPREMVAVGKQGFIYLLDRDNLGKFNATTNNVLQTVSLGHGFWGNPAYFNSAVYYHGVNDVLKRFTLTNGLLSAAPASQSTITYPTWPGATPSVSSNGTANGIVWEVQFETTHQVLHAYNATSLTELFNSNQNTARDQMGAGVKFIAPTIADGRVFVGSTGALSIYGLIQPVTTAPAAPSNLVATAQSLSALQLDWVDNSDAESGFKIEKSLDGVSFTPLDLVGVDARQYTDTAVAPNTKYYYRVRATNAINDSAYSNVADATTLPPTGAVYLYHFDAGTGTASTDSASGNNGTLVGSPLPQWLAPGKVGAGALSFSGDGVYNQAASESAVSLTTNLAPVLGSTSTLDFWVQTTQRGNNAFYLSPAITGVEQINGTNDIDWGTIDASGRIGVYVGNSGGAYSTNPINDGQWHNVAITRNATTGKAQIFVDGALNSSSTLEAGNKTSPFNSIGALTVVAADGTTRTGANYFNGKLDEVRIYNTVIGANQIAALAVPPAAPVLQSATVAAGPIAHLVFSSPSTFTENMEIYRKVGVNGPFTLLTTVSGSTTVYDDPVEAGQSYYYALKGTDTAGSSVLSNTLVVMPPIPTIIGVHAFYNRSNFDGQNGSSNVTDRNAIATDKEPLLPGHTATFANYTSYSRGLNGVIIDVADMDVLPRIDDFEFKVGNSSDLSTWVQAPTPSYINTYPGRGPGASTQITVIWDDNEIQNEWLQVRVLAEPHLGLADDSTFYFGNAIGETGDSAADAQTTSTDASRVNAGATNNATVTNLFDINRDTVVDSADTAIVNSNFTDNSTALQLISLGNAPTVATPATATPLIVTGTSTTLSALGADNGGESSLTYTWTQIGEPPAPVTFSSNGTNAAKSTTATFTQAGNYDFLVIISDASNFSVTSQVSVQVNRTASTIGISPALTSLAAGTTANFTATEFDQFGDAMSAQPTFTWSKSNSSSTITTSGVYTAPAFATTDTITASAGALSANRPLTILNDVFASYQANESGGTALADSSGNAENAMLTGAASFTPGISGNALTLTGGYATVPTGIVSNLNDFTIAAWVKVTTLAAWSRIFDFGTGAAVNMFLTPDAGDTGKLRFAITTGGNGAEQRIDGPAMTVNAWTHIAVTLSGDKASLYVNGVLVGTNDAMTLHPTHMGFTTLNYMGKSQYAGDPNLNGSVDDFRIYTRALTAQQIVAIGATPLAVAQPASATPATVTATSTNLSVLGVQTQTGNDIGLTYTWSVLGTPPANPTFSVNGTNAAKNTTVTFTAAGTYSFQVAIANSIGQTVLSTVNVTVTPTLATVTPATTTAIAGTPIQFIAVDQFGTTMSATWTTSAGAINANGLLSVPSNATSLIVTATNASVVRNATVTISRPRVWYKNDSITGTTLTDSSGNNNAATLTGSFSSAAGRIDNALQLSGGYASLPTGIMSGATDFTISTWLNLTSKSTWMRVFDFGTGTNANMFLTVSDGNFVRFAITTGGGGAEQRINTTTSLQTGQWYFLAVVLSGQQATLYVNGAVAGTRNNMTLNPAALGNTTLNYLGKSQYPDPALAGRIDDFRIYNVAASASAISSMYAAGNAYATAAPSSVTASAVSSSQVNVTWNDNAGAGVEVGYLVERATNAAFTSGLASFALSGDTTSYSDTSVAANTTYYYRVTTQLGGGIDVGPVAATSAVTTPQFITGSFIRNASAQRIDYDFHGAVPGSVSVSSLSLQNLTTGQTITGANYSVTGGGTIASFTFPNYASGLPDGAYQAQLNGGSTFTFVILAGDADGDGVVNTADFVILASHFNQSGATWSQGDFNYDGKVNALDFNALATRFGITSPSPAAASAVPGLFGEKMVSEALALLD